MTTLRLLPPSYSCEGPQFALAGWQIPDLAYQAQPVLLAPGDRLVLLTDGMFERRAADAEVARLLSGMTLMPPREVAQALTRAVLEVTAGAVRDDATVLVLDWNGPERTAPSQRHPA